MNRIDLQTVLEELLGSRNVYFQPPENTKLQYPCIIYSLSGIDTTRADNKNYLKRRQYDLTYIGKDPDTTMQDKLIEALPYCRYDRRFVSDNLYHDTFTLYYY